MAAAVHLVRHGEVDNPDGVVYADLDGFDLSPDGRAEADATAEHLASRPIEAVVSSPLLRAARTAAIVAGPHRLEVATDPRLTEWGLSRHWAGLRWADLPDVRPGELEAYLEHPWDLPFSPESIAEVAARMAAAILAASADVAGEVVVVSHQDPVQAARLKLTGRSLRVLLENRPGHASVVTLTPGEPWSEASYFEPVRAAGPLRTGRRDDGSAPVS